MRGLENQIESIKKAFLALTLIACSEAEQKTEVLPEDFILGVSIGGFQFEMGGGIETEDPNSDWWVWLHDQDNIKFGYVSGDMPEDGPNFWEKYPEDIILARYYLGVDAFRFAIEWSRIFPSSTKGVKVKVKLTEDGLPAEIEIEEEDLKKLDALASKNAIEHYRKVLLFTRDINIKPIVTLHHFTLPLWLHDPLVCRDWLSEHDYTGAGCNGGPAGWLSQEIVVEITKYAAYLAWKLGDLVDMWNPINEPMVIPVAGFVAGDIGALAGAGTFPPAGMREGLAFKDVMLRVVYAHARMYDVIKKWDKVDADGDGANSKVFLVHNMTWFEPVQKDLKAANDADYLLNLWCLNALLKGMLDDDFDGKGEEREELKRKADLIGINYYSRVKVISFPNLPEYKLTFIPKFPPACEIACDDGWRDIHPEGLRKLILKVWKDFGEPLGIPIMITENGLADSQDKLRSWFISSHLAEVKKAIDKGADVKGYLYWALIDHLEWSAGYDMKFGLFEVEPESKTRTPRKSSETFRKICLTRRLF